MSNGDGVVLTVRLIRSFEHRNIRHIVFKNVDLNQTTQEFMENINRGIPCFVLSNVFIQWFRDKTMKAYENVNFEMSVAIFCREIWYSRVLKTVRMFF